MHHVKVHTRAFLYGALAKVMMEDQPLSPPFRFHTLASAAEKGGQEVGQYLSSVLQQQENFMNTNEVIDRGDFLESLRVLHKQQFSLVLGRKNLGKTLMRIQTVDELEKEANVHLTVIDVNMREHQAKNS